MSKIKLLFIAAAVCFSVTCFSQKVKYKDLFILLNAKQYDQAEPFLKRYLKENDDNPNAYLFMGIIYQEKANKNDVLKATEELTVNADSAVYFYGLALKTITEKELKRNDEYYQIYNRRDLRTGEFGVKISDVQFDLEKRVQTLKDRKEKVNQLKVYYKQAETLYFKTMAQFKFLISRYPGEKEFFLRADEKQSAELYKIIDVYDSAMAAFNNYKSVSQTLGKTGYNQTVNLSEIHVYGKDGFTEANFMSDDLKLWDYKRWAQAAINSVDKEMKPIRENLISYDIEINKLREKLKKDSVSVKSDLTQLVNKLLISQLKKYDADPMPIQVFGMKTAELEYASELLQNRASKDSANAQFQLAKVERELSAVKKLDSIAGKLAARNFDQDVENYNHFISASYGTAAVLKSLISGTKEYAEREKQKKESEMLIKAESFKWLVVANDSIPVVTAPGKETRFKPLIIVDESYTAGFTYADSIATGYFYRITPTRIPDVKVNFPVNKAGFKKRNLPITKALSATDGKDQVYFVCFYSEAKIKDKFPVTIAKIYRTDGLAWSKDYQFDMLPAELVYNIESGELSVKVNTGAGDVKLLTVDKTGKLIQ